MKFIFHTAVLVCVFKITDYWQAPANPDPKVILDEAESDAEAGRFKDALAKHVWFHDHALEHVPSLYGVRLSYALDSWRELGKNYPPALEKLKQTRDDAAKQVIEHRGSIRNKFADLRAINRVLGEEDKTVAAFIELDKKSQKAAREVYDLAQPSLVAAKEYKLCGKYLEPKKAYARTVELLKLDHEFAEELESLEEKQQQLEFAEKMFMDRAATLIALLVLNERKPEAECIAKDAMSKSNHPASKAVIGVALKGKAPEQKD